MRNTGRLIFALLLLIGLCHAQNPTIDELSVEKYVQRELDRWEVPGAAVCVVKDGKVLVSKGFGVRKQGKAKKVDENTLFLIGSNSKAFTGTALAMLEQEGKCHLSDPVKQYLPNFKMHDEYLTENITLTDILCHRMGFETFQGDFMYWTSDLSETEVLEKFGQLEPMYDFRTKWGYTNAGYAVSGECIKTISRQRWENYLEDRIFGPLKMDRTLALSADLEKARNRCVPHTLEGDKQVAVPFPMIDNLAPAGAIASSVEDMSHWLIAQLNGGKYAGKQVIPEAAITRTRKPESIIGRGRHPFNKSHYTLYGLGWMLKDYEGYEIVSHTGGVNGFLSAVTLVPEANLGVVVLTNNDQNSMFQSVAAELVDAYLGLPYRDYSNLYHKNWKTHHEADMTTLKAKQDSVAMGLPPAHDLKEYAGRYIHPIYGAADLEVKGSSLVMKLEHHSNITATLGCLGGNRFLCDYHDAAYGIKVFPFKEEDGKVRSFTLSVADFLEFTTYEFVKR